MKIYIGNSGWKFGYLAAQYPGRLGWIMTPHDMRYPDKRIPYIFDNGVWSDHINNREFDEKKFWDKLNDTVRRQKPSWVVVPDKVADRDETLRRWDRYAPILINANIPMFMAAQDGMEPCDVPSEAAGVFVGGSTEWKWRNLRMWTESFKHVHVGRVNSYRLLMMAHNAGAESVDGSGWFRGDIKQTEELERYLDETTNGKLIEQGELI